MTDETPREPQAEIKIVGYCRVCGTGLDEANVRTANGTIYCALHVPPATPPPPPHNGSPYASPYSAPAGGPMPTGSSDASPGAAFVLGLIPGVGAIYNGQYAKGILHIIILAMLFAGADRSGGGSEPFFALLIPGFWAYMAFEAYHTAKRRREGLPIDEFSGFDLGRAGGQTKIPLAPILLIFFGVIFLLDNLGVLEIRELLRFWPVGMIALGAYLLVARMKGDPGDQR
jgi:hypothetical protein